MKPVQTLSAFGAMLSLVAGKVTVLVDAIANRDPKVPALTMQMRGALDVVEAGLGDVRRSLDTIDGGGV
jgi:hypothetical protein